MLFLADQSTINISTNTFVPNIYCIMVLYTIYFNLLDLYFYFYNFIYLFFIRNLMIIYISILFNWKVVMLNGFLLIILSITKMPKRIVHYAILYKSLVFPRFVPHFSLSKIISTKFVLFVGEKWWPSSSKRLFFTCYVLRDLHTSDTYCPCNPWNWC